MLSTKDPVTTMDHDRAARPAEILMVEDNEDYAYLTRRAFGITKLRANLHHVSDGEQCLRFLRRQPPYAGAPAPDIVLLDLDLPVMDGCQTLAEIVRDESLKHLAVVVLTSETAPAEILRVYRLRCSAYMCKPVEFDKYVEMMKTFADYWLSSVMLPTRCAGSLRDRPLLL